MDEYAKRIIVHPIVFALFPILSLFIGNVTEVALRDVVAPVLIVLIVTVVLWLVATRLIGNAHKAAAIVSMFLVLFFSFGHVHAAVTLLLYSTSISETGFLPVASASGPIVWLLLWTLLFLFAVYLILKSSGDRLLTATSNVVAACLLAGVLLNWGLTQMPRSDGSNEVRGDRTYEETWQRTVEATVPRVDETAQPTVQPDIYYIVLDGFGRADVLRTMYEVDIFGLHDFLRARGFYVAEQSRANYSSTVLSLASSFNYTYLDALTSEAGPDTSDQRPAAAMIRHNRLVTFLERQGYTIVTFPSGVGFSDLAGADRVLAPTWNLNTFQNELINSTPLPIVLRLPVFKTQQDLHRDRILFAFERLAEAGGDGKPTFVFAHVMVPHPPFVFGADGDARQNYGKLTVLDGSDFTTIVGREAYVEGYRDQAAFVAGKLQETIDDILATSSEPAIVIVQGDHGPGSMFHWHSLHKTNVHERLPIFNAYYFPNGEYDALYPGITPVNTFRVVLNTYFGTEYELLEDRSYYASSDRLYDFIDVTAELEPSAQR